MRIVAVLALLGAGLGTSVSQSAPQLALYSPATAGALARIEDYLLTRSALGPRLTALLPLITAREMNLAYEGASAKTPRGSSASSPRSSTSFDATDLSPRSPATME